MTKDYLKLAEEFIKSGKPSHLNCRENETCVESTIIEFASFLQSQEAEKGEEKCCCLMCCGENHHHSSIRDHRGRSPLEGLKEIGELYFSTNADMKLKINELVAGYQAIIKVLKQGK